MRKSKLMAKIRAGKPAKLAYLGHFIPPFIAHAANAGYDAIWFDMEHRAMEPREVQAMMGFFHLYDIDCILRTPTREKTLLYRFLEDGATGLIIPLVDTVAEAQDLVNSVKFPPIGDRGLEGKGLDASFGLDTATPEGKAAFVTNANQETPLIIQLESPEAVRQADAIAALDGVDIIFIGPTDFELRGKASGDSMTWDEALTIMDSAAKKHGKAWGVMPRNVAQVKDYTERGAQFIPWGHDIKFVIDGLKRTGAELDDIYG